MAQATEKYARLSVERLRVLFDYDPKTGVLRWRVREDASKCWNTRYGGSIVNAPAKGGYIVASVSTEGRRANYLAHRIAWALMTGEWPDPEIEVDHKNGRRKDNRWRNLRLATQHQNRMNNTLARSKSGFKGVYVVPQTTKFLAMLRAQKRNVHLGYHHDARDAARAYDAAAIKHFGEFAKTNAALGLL